MSTAELSIARLHGRYRIPRRHPHPERLRERLDRALKTGLPGILETRLRPLLDQGGEGVWLIRRLETQIALDAGLLDAGLRDGARLEKAIAGQISAAIARIIHAPPDGSNSLFFPTWADYAARFAADLAGGGDAGAWYYAPFAGLRSLERGQALREAILRRPEQAAAILLTLARRGSLEAVLSALGETGAGRILGALPRPSAAPTRPLVDQILRVWAALPPSDGPVLNALNHLRLWAAWRMQAGPAPQTGGSEAQAHAAIVFLLHLAGFLRSRPDPRAGLDELAGAAVSGSLPGLDAAGMDLSQIARTLAAGESAWLERVARRLSPAPGAAAALPGGRSLVHCAGLFLLLPAWLDLGLDELIASYAPATRDAAIWRYWLALKCLGSPRLALSRRDPALLAAVGLDAAPTPDEMESAAAALTATPGLLPALQRAFWLALAKTDRANARAIGVETCTRPDGAQTRVLHDLRLDFWLAIIDPEQSLEAALDRLGMVLGQPAAMTWDETGPPPADLPVHYQPYLRSSKASAPDLEYFHLPGLPPAVDDLWTLMARAVLRIFALRLMGFAWSSPEYLYTRFLEGPGALQHTPGGWWVELPQAPLHTVLRLSGMDEETLHLPWLDGPDVTLAFRAGG